MIVCCLLSIFKNTTPLEKPGVLDRFCINGDVHENFFFLPNLKPQAVSPSSPPAGFSDGSINAWTNTNQKNSSAPNNPKQFSWNLLLTRSYLCFFFSVVFIAAQQVQITSVHWRRGGSQDKHGKQLQASTATERKESSFFKLLVHQLINVTYTMLKANSD